MSDKTANRWQERVQRAGCITTWYLLTYLILDQMPLEVHLRRGHQVRLITHLSMYSLTVHRGVGRPQGQLNHKDVRHFLNQRVSITYAVNKNFNGRFFIISSGKNNLTDVNRNYETPCTWLVKLRLITSWLCHVFQVYPETRCTSTPAGTARRATTSSTSSRPCRGCSSGSTSASTSRVSSGWTCQVRVSLGGGFEGGFVGGRFGGFVKGSLERGWLGRSERLRG